jgi:hypothetical protein
LTQFQHAIIISFTQQQQHNVRLLIPFLCVIQPFFLVCFISRLDTHCRRRKLFFFVVVVSRIQLQNTAASNCKRKIKAPTIIFKTRTNGREREKIINTKTRTIFYSFYM